MDRQAVQAQKRMLFSAVFLSLLRKTLSMLLTILPWLLIAWTVISMADVNLHKWSGEVAGWNLFILLWKR